MTDKAQWTECYCRACNAVQWHVYSSYCNKNHAKQQLKIEKLKKRDEQLLYLLRDDPLVEIPMVYHFGFPKSFSNHAHLKITQTAVPIVDFHYFLYSIDMAHE
jgi:hypothetical protein